MKREKRARLEGAGWKVGEASDFLELTKEEAAFVDLKVALASSLKRRRQSKRWTQTQLANAIGSSQPRVAKMEAADSSVSVDLLIKALLTIGATRRDLAKVIGAPKARSAAELIGVNRLATALTGSDPANTVCRQAAPKVN